MTQEITVHHTAAVAMSSSVSALPPSLQVLMDEAVYNRCMEVARTLSRSPLVGMAMAGKPEACFTALIAAMEWKLQPLMVMRNVYPIVGGNLMFSGKMVRTIAESSGYLSGPIQYEHFGPWEKVQGKQVIKESTKTDENGDKKKYAAPGWQLSDEKGVGVRVILPMKGEDKPREYEFYLEQARPRNSTLWATDPKTQIIYAATRRAIDAVAPHLLLGMPFDDGLEPIGPDNARDVTPPAAFDPIMAALVDAPAEIPAEVEIIPPPPSAAPKASFTMANPETGETTDYPRNPGGMKQAVAALQEAITAVADQPDQMARWATANSAMLEDAIAAATAKGMPETNITLQNARSILDLAAPVITEPSNVE